MSDKNNEQVFDKAIFGGYEASQVDDFAAQATAIISKQKAEIASLKQKLQVLADRVCELEGNPSSQPNSPSGSEQDADMLLAALEDTYRRHITLLEAALASANASLKQSVDIQLAEHQQPKAEPVPQASEPVPAPAAVPAAVPVQEPKQEPKQEQAARPIITVTRLPKEPVEAPEQPVVAPVVPATETVSPGSQSVLEVAPGELDNMSYEEALAHLLQKNGLVDNKTVPMPAEDERPTRKVPKVTTNTVPRASSVPSAQPSSAPAVSSYSDIVNPPKPDAKPQKKGMFASLKSSISSFLNSEDEDDEEDETLSESSYRSTSQNSGVKNGELQFGKNYDVKKKGK